MDASPGPSDVSRQALTVFSRKDTRMCRTSRPLVSLATAALLLWGEKTRLRFGARGRALLAWLSRNVYGIFLLHYPVVMLFGVAVERLWPAQAGPAALGLLAAWATTLWLAQALHDACEAPHGILRRTFGRASPGPR